jgi:hypothetical protein
MPQTLISLYVHVIFSTKNRMIRPEIEDRLFAYMGGIANNHGCKLLAAPPTCKISCDLVGHLKRDSSS